MNEAKVRKIIAEADKAEADASMAQRRDRLAGEDIVSRQQVYQFFAKFNTEIRDQALQIPISLRKSWPKKTAKKIEADLTEQIEMYLRNLAAWRPRIEGIGGANDV